jgi:hypothetical protein
VEICFVDALEALERASGRGKGGQRLRLVGRVATLEQAEEVVGRLQGQPQQPQPARAALDQIAEEEPEEPELEHDAMEEEEDSVGAAPAETAEASSEDDVDTAQAAVAASAAAKARQFVRTQEDEDFDADFAKLMKDTLEHSGRGNLSGAAVR